MEDPYLAPLLEHYFAVGGLGQPTLVVMDGKPHAKMRHRSGKNNRTYQPVEDANAEEHTAHALRQAYRGRHESNVALVATFVLPDKRTRDNDNLMKHLLDSANGVIFHDDRQVTGQGSRIELDPHHPRTLILFGAHESSLDRTVDLAAARKRTLVAAQQKLRKNAGSRPARRR